MGSFDDTSLVAAVRNTLNSSEFSLHTINTELKNRYIGLFQDWAISVNAGKIDNSNPPRPPSGYELSQPDHYGFQWPQAGTQLVCDMPRIPEDRSKIQVQVAALGETKRNVPAGDTMPNGYEATAPDGSKWVKKESPTPFGMAHYYERL